MVENSIYNDKNNSYFTEIRKDLLDLIPLNKRSLTVLEVGSGDGSTLKYAIKNGYANTIHGIELCAIDNSFQKDDDFTSFIIGNIEQIDLPYEVNSIDVIICGDVLEHLIDPLKVLEKLKVILKYDGILIASIPNFREYSVIKKVFLQGDFGYEKSGILDKTHLRFYCKKNIKELFINAGFQLSLVTNNLNRYPKRQQINNFTFGIFEEFLSVKYNVVCTK